MVLHLSRELRESRMLWAFLGPRLREDDSMILGLRRRRAGSLSIV